MSGAGFKFTNNSDKKLLDALRKMPREDMGPIAEAMLSPGAQQIKTSAQALVPKDTGALAASIKASKVTEKRGRKKSEWKVTVMPGTRKQLGIDRDALGYYPAVIEFGHQMSNVRHTYKDRKTGMFRRGGMVVVAPQPFLRPALYNNTGSIENDARRAAATMIPAAFMARAGRP